MTGLLLMFAAGQVTAEVIVAGTRQIADGYHGSPWPALFGWLVRLHIPARRTPAVKDLVAAAGCSVGQLTEPDTQALEQAFCTL